MGGGTGSNPILPRPSARGGAACLRRARSGLGVLLLALYAARLLGPCELSRVVSVSWRFIHMHVCMYVCMYGHHIQQEKDQPGKVANPARGQLNRENEYFPVPVRACEFGLARGVRQPRPASACSAPYSG